MWISGSPDGTASDRFRKQRSGGSYADRNGGRSFMLGTGILGLGKLRRFKKYQKTLEKRTYCDLTKLAQAVGKPVKFVKKDLKKMIGKGWFTEGCLTAAKPA